MFRRALATHAKSSSIKARYDIVQKLKQCKTPQQLTSAIAQIPPHQFDAVTCTSAIKLCTSKKLSSDEALVQVLNACRNVQDFTPSNLAECVESFAVGKREIPQELLSKLTKLTEFHARELSTIAWSLQKMKQPAQYVRDTIAQEILGRRSIFSFKPQELSRTAWAFVNQNPALLDRLAKEAMSQGLQEFTPPQLCMLVSSMTECENAALVEKTAREVMERPGFLKQCSNRNVAELLRTFSTSKTLQPIPTGLANHFAKDLMLRRDLEMMYVQDFVHMVESLVKLLAAQDEYDNLYVFHRMLQQMNFALFTAKQIEAICIALFALRILPNAEWLAEASKRVEDAEALTCFAKWNYFPEELVSRICQSEQHATVQTLWNLACLDLLQHEKVRELFLRSSSSMSISDEERVEYLSQLQQIQLAWKQAGNKEMLFNGKLQGQSEGVPPEGDSLRVLRQRIASCVQEREEDYEVEIEAFAVPGIQVDVLLPQQRIVIELELEDNTLEDGSQRNGFARFQQRLLEREGFTVHYISQAGFEELEEDEQQLFVEQLVKR